MIEDYSNFKEQNNRIKNEINKEKSLYFIHVAQSAKKLINYLDEKYKILIIKKYLFISKTLNINIKKQTLNNVCF